MEISARYVSLVYQHWCRSLTTLISGTFMVFACACFAAYLWSTYVVPETANVSLEEVDAVFRSSVGQEDAQLKSQVCYTFSQPSLEGTSLNAIMYL